MLRQIYYQFLVYRSIAFPFLVVSSIIVPCWLAFRLYRRRAAGNKVSIQREVLYLIFVVYLSGLAAATLAPNRNPRLLVADTTGIELRPRLATLTCSAATFPEGSKARAFCIYNAKGNLLLFLPLGILIPLIWKKLSFWKGIQAAVALSIAIELLQLVSRVWNSYRSADVNDVILNVAGASLGLLLWSLLRLRGRTARLVTLTP